ncbi:tetratricopeptide repeat protein [Spirosoma utsteinense]|uniref:Tetratricopeptide (TPR) repeat protein n=1 Tax=Spirosoma utsteinense TaxID=2585773 RepID=A0ABR6W5C3_9BACT|nr:tetratricopeptide (TPR) repeat protein [Spirosoma utsteinense]
MNVHLTISLCLLASLPVLGQHTHSTHTAATQSATHCRAPEIRKVALPPPQLMEGIGKSHLKITTKSDSAQRFFDQGLSLLHDFWDFEAHRAFEYAAKLDTTAAMPHWGLYMAIQSSDPKRQADKKKALELAKKWSKSASEQEQLYIKAIEAEAAATEAKKSREERNRAFTAEMDNLIHRYPDDVEAKLILWLGAIGGSYSADGKPEENTMYAQLMLEKLLVSHPDHHAVHHYWIHQMENCCPQAALASAQKLASLAPASGHIVHMPGHIYYRLGDYKRARQSFLAAMRVDSAYMSRQGIHRLDTWNYDHNLQYLIANDAEEGRYREATAILSRLLDKSGVQDTARAQDFKKWAFNVSQKRPVSLAVRFGQFAQAADYQLRNLADTAAQRAAMGDKAYTEFRKTPLRRTRVAYFLGMDAVEKGKLDLARQYANELDADLWRATRQDKTVSGYEETMLSLYSVELQGNLYSLQGDTTHAFRLLREAVKMEKELGYQEPPLYEYPIRLSLAKAYQRARQWQKARDTYQDLLKERPNSGFALFGLGQVWEVEGNRAEATKAYQRFLTTWHEADTDLPQVKKARDWVRVNNGPVTGNTGSH